MDCEKDVLRIQKKLDKIVKEDAVKMRKRRGCDTLPRIFWCSMFCLFFDCRVKMRHWTF